MEPLLIFLCVALALVLTPLFLIHQEVKRIADAIETAEQRESRIEREKQARVARSEALGRLKTDQLAGRWAFARTYECNGETAWVVRPPWEAVWALPQRVARRVMRAFGAG